MGFKFKILGVVILALQCLTTSAQSWNDFYLSGAEALENADYYSAQYYLEKCMDLDSSVFDLNVKYAESLRLTKHYAAAEYQYEKVFKKDKGKLFPLGQFKLGEMQFMNGHYKKAVRSFKKFKRKKNKEVDASFYEVAAQWVKSATFALNSQNALLESRLVETPADLNQAELQLAPLKVDSTLFFSSYSDAGDFLELKTVSTRKDSLLSSINKIPLLGLAESVDVANLSLGEGNTVYFSICKNDTCSIYTGQLIEGLISDREKLNLNTGNSSVSMPHYVAKGSNEYLLFSANLVGGFGGNDIWYSQKTSGKWSTPINLGATINTGGEEVSPFYDGESLFFSSNWHNGFGGFDIVFSKGWLAKWSAVKNPGKPINSSYHDLYYSYNPSLAEGWFSSNRVSDENLANATCCSKLYRFEYPDSLEINQKNYKDLEELNKYLPVTLYFHNDEPNPRTRLTETEFNYLTTYQSYLDLVPTYKKENSKGTRGETKLDAELDVEEFFEYFVQKGVADLELFSELLLKELETGKSVELEVKGYASPRAKSDYNENLSRRRISSLVNYLNEYKGGVFKPYLKEKAFNGASLSIVENPFGEEAASATVSDALEDEKESIYSRGARLERKIEIRSVTFKEPETLPNESVLELGDITSTELVNTTYTLENTGTEPIQLDSIISSCGCTVPSLEKDFIPAGESLEIGLEFNPEGKSGYQEKRVVIYSSSFTEPKILTLRSFVH